MEIIQTHHAAAMHVVLFCIIAGAVSGSLGLNEDVIVGRLEALEFQLAKVTQRGGTSRAQRQSKNYTAPDVPVAFSAYRNFAGTVGAGQSIVFDVVYVNQGNGYHHNHGLFIAPQSGIYVFLVSLMHPSQSKPGHHSIVKNGQIFARFHSESSQYEQTSQSVILNVNAGDEIYVRNDDNDEYYGSGLYSSFSGFLLFQSS